jgi:hypothetical protein
MGGIGSGREGNRIAVEACLSLDINNLRRQGLLGSGVHARWSWTHDGEEVASLEMLVGFGVLHLEGVDHRYDARKIDHAVSTTYTSCNYGEPPVVPVSQLQPPGWQAVHAARRPSLLVPALLRPRLPQPMGRALVACQAPRQQAVAEAGRRSRRRPHPAAPAGDASPDL